MCSVVVLIYPAGSVYMARVCCGYKGCPTKAPAEHNLLPNLLTLGHLCDCCLLSAGRLVFEWMLKHSDPVSCQARSRTKLKQHEQ